MKAWIAAVVLATAACGQPAPAASDPLNASVADVGQFKAKYKPAFELHCINPSCYVTSYEAVFDRLPQDVQALPPTDAVNMRTRIEMFAEDVDSLTRKGCGDPATDSTLPCRLAALGPEAAVDYVRSYINS